MKRWGVLLAIALAVACAKEKKEENAGMSNQPPTMSADSARAADSAAMRADTTMMRDTAKAAPKE
ncbi:MAG: hypothetical protein HY700_04530 [Gemmatimonadetes bacterium]|nr:hypothetical protein [Gemmatimonadota bacterium]